MKIMIPAHSVMSDVPAHNGNCHKNRPNGSDRTRDYNSRKMYAEWLPFLLYLVSLMVKFLLEW